MKKEIEPTDRGKTKTEMQELKKEIQNNASKEDLYLFRLEDYCNSLRDAIINCTLNLPSRTSFRFYLSKLGELGNIEYILELLHECWILTHPSKMFDSVYKDKDLDKILDNSLSKYIDPSTDSARYDDSYDVVSEELNAPTNFTIANVYYRKIKENGMIHLFREYLDELYKMINSLYKDKDFWVEEGFVPKSYLKVALSRNQLQSIFERIAAAGFIADDKATKHSFLSLFSNTLHTPDQKIIWLERNKKNNKPSIASLYVLFYTMKGDVNSYDKKIICNFFHDANNVPISPEKLKLRGDSSILQRIKSIVGEIVEAK